MPKLDNLCSTNWTRIILIVTLLIGVSPSYSAIIGPSSSALLPTGWTATSLGTGERVLIDTSGNQWLSPYYTINNSVNTALGTYGSQGFSVASISQFDSLLRTFWASFSPHAVPSGSALYNGTGFTELLTGGYTTTAANVAD